MKKLLLIAALVCSSIGMNAQQLIFPQAPPAPTARFFGTTASTSYYYWVSARYPWGFSAPSNSGFVTNGSSSLSSANIVNVTWATMPSATGYDLLRTSSNSAPTGSCNCALVANTTATSYNDIGNALLTYTLATPGLIYSDASAQTTAAPSAGGLTAAKLATINDTGNNLPVVTISGNASAVNDVQVANAATTVAPVISAIGSDTNIDLKFSAKGSGIVNVPGVVYSSSLTITTANLNAGTSNALVADVAGRTLTPVGFTMQALGGATATCTSVSLQDTAGSPVVIATEAAAGLVQNQIINEASAVANLTLGAGWNVALTTGKGIVVVKTGSSCATATSFVFQVRYKIS